MENGHPVGWRYHPYRRVTKARLERKRTPDSDKNFVSMAKTPFFRVFLCSLRVYTNLPQNASKKSKKLMPKSMVQ